MKKVLVLVVAWLVLGPGSKACLNGFDEKFYSNSGLSRTTFPVPHGHPMEFDSEDAQDFIAESKQGYAEGNLQNSIDYGLILTYQGKYKQAENVFAKVAQQHPDEYVACANYGTLLEVNGKLKEAQKWLQKALEINPDAHDGSEWLHLKIIEAKIAKTKPVDGAALTGHDFGTEDEPVTDLTMPEAIALRKTLFFQLNERMTFIQPKDPYIAALLFELGNTCLLFGEKQFALDNFAAAQEYGLKSPLLDKRIARAKNQASLAHLLPKDPERAAQATPPPAENVQPAAAKAPVPVGPIIAQQATTLLKIAIGAGAVVLLQLLIHLIYRARGKNDVPASLPENAAGPSRN